MGDIRLGTAMLMSFAMSMALAGPGMDRTVPTDAVPSWLCSGSIPVGGARRVGCPAPYFPSELMAEVARNVFEEELRAAADYFARQTLRPRVDVRETARVPRSRVVGLVFAADPKGGFEPLGIRLMEFAPDPRRHELRDDRLRYVAYVPRGSVDRGEHIAETGTGDPGTACIACHGAGLRGAASAPMQEVATSLTPAAMIDAVAYAASLTP